MSSDQGWWQFMGLHARREKFRWSPVTDWVCRESVRLWQSFVDFEERSDLVCWWKFYEKDRTAVSGDGDRAKIPETLEKEHLSKNEVINGEYFIKSSWLLPLYHTNFDNLENKETLNRGAKVLHRMSHRGMPVGGSGQEWIWKEWVWNKEVFQRAGWHELMWMPCPRYRTSDSKNCSVSDEDRSDMRAYLDISSSWEGIVFSL